MIPSLSSLVLCNHQIWLANSIPCETRPKKVLKLYQIRNVHLYMTYPPRWHQPLINWFIGYCQLIVLITLSATTKFDWLTPYHAETRPKKVLKLYRIHNVYVHMTYPPRWHQSFISWFNGFCQLIVLITLSATTKFDWLTPYHVETRPKKVLKLYRIHNVYVYMTYPPRWHQSFIS